MAHRTDLIAIVLLAAFSGLPVHAQSGNERYSIMRPEPGNPPGVVRPYVSPHGTRQHVITAHIDSVQPPQTSVPPAIYVPQTNRALPNLPAPSGAVAGGAETGQDRAARCAHQAGLYGEATGDRSTYIGTCLNQ